MTDISPTKPVDGRSTGYKVAEVRDDGTIVLFLEDGETMFTARTREGLEGVRKGSVVVIKAGEADKSGAPTDAEVVRLA